MTQPSLEERWWDLVHTLAVKLHSRVEGVADRVCGVTWGLQRAIYYRWAALGQDRVQSEPPIGDVCPDCGWTLEVKPEKLFELPGWWFVGCPNCDRSIVGHGWKWTVDEFGRTSKWNHREKELKADDRT